MRFGFVSPREVCINQVVAIRCDGTGMVHGVTLPVLATVVGAASAFAVAFAALVSSSAVTCLSFARRTRVDVHILTTAHVCHVLQPGMLAITTCMCECRVTYLESFLECWMDASWM